MVLAAAQFIVDAGPEGQLVELPALQALCGEPGRIGAGWTYVHGPDLAPDAPAAERRLWSDVMLLGRLGAAVNRLNPHLPPDAVQRVCDLTLTTTSPTVVEDHRSLHELLLSGVLFATKKGKSATTTRGSSISTMSTTTNSSPSTSSRSSSAGRTADRTSCS